MHGAAERIFEFTRGKSLADYRADAALRSAVHWQFAIIGEALTRLRQRCPDVTARISEYARIIAFRNQILHGYDVIRDEITWHVVQVKLPVLHQELTALLAEPDS